MRCSTAALHATPSVPQSKALQQPASEQRPASQACSVSYLYVKFPACHHRWATTFKQAPSTPPAAASWQAMTPSSWTSLGPWYHRRAELRNRLCVTLLKVVFFYYPSLLATILSLFACYPIDPATHGSELYPQYAQVRKPLSYPCHASSGRMHLDHTRGSSFALQVHLTCLWCFTCTTGLDLANLSVK